MKMVSAVLALVIALFVGGTASAASWQVIRTDGDIVTSIDKDSIRRGTDSKKFPKFNRKDGYSAIVKLDMKISESENFDMVYLISFYEKNGERMFCLLDGYGETNYPSKDSEVLQEKVDLEGRVWPDVWTYIEKHLK